MKLGRAQAVTMAAALWFLLPAQGCTPAQKFNGEVVEPASQAPELTGVNWDGKPFKLSDHRGKVALVFFGYTYCPDVMEVVFVSVDPKRDTVEKLSRYVPSFDRRFYGLRREPQEIEAVSKAFDLTVQYGQPKEGPETDSFYYVDHTGTFFVIDREGRLRLKFPPNATVQQMVPDLQKLLAV